MSEIKIEISSDDDENEADIEIIKKRKTTTLTESEIEVEDNFLSFQRKLVKKTYFKRKKSSIPIIIDNSNVSTQRDDQVEFINTNATFFDKLDVNEQDDEHFCNICQSSFEFPIDLQNHMKFIHRPLTINSVDKAFCDLCKKLYKEEDIEDHSPCYAVDVVCFFCYRHMPCKSHFGFHNLTWARHRKFLCNFCHVDTTVMSYYELNNHLSLEHKTRLYKCPKCFTNFNNSISAKMHSQQHKCKCLGVFCYCNLFKEYYNKAIFDEENLEVIQWFPLHIKSNHLWFNNKNKPTNTYSKNKEVDNNLEVQKLFILNFNNTEQNSENIEVIQPFKNQEIQDRLELTKVYNHFKCKKCSMIFFSEIFLQQHQCSTQANLCNICGITLENTEDLNEHKKKHDENYRCKCDICNKKFTSWECLQEHIYTHKKPAYKCDFCKRDFSQMTSLVYHLMMHTKEKFRVCSICGVKCSSFRELSSHITMHNENGTNPYKCLTCNELFTHKYKLLGHMATHKVI